MKTYYERLQTISTSLSGLPEIFSSRELDLISKYFIEVIESTPISEIEVLQYNQKQIPNLVPQKEGTSKTITGKISFVTSQRVQISEPESRNVIAYYTNTQFPSSTTVRYSGQIVVYQPETESIPSL